MRLIILLFCLFLTNFAFATTYYLDYTGESNANDGLSPATAWKDLFKIREVNSPGDVFLFKRGETWAGIRLYITEPGTSSQPIRYGAYGTGGADPIITTVDTLANADAPLAWTEDSPGIWKMNLARTPGRLFLDDIEYLRANNTAEIGTTEAQGTINYWYYDTGGLYVYATQNPATRYTTIKGSQFAYTSQAGLSHKTTNTAKPPAAARRSSDTQRFFYRNAAFAPRFAALPREPLFMRKPLPAR